MTYFKYCSHDARKVIKKLPHLSDRLYLIESILFNAYSHNFLYLYKKHDNFDKAMSMIKNKYFKNVDREMDQINWNDGLWHYQSLVNKYLKADFNYSDLSTLNDISRFSLPIVESLYHKLKVKNLWYIRKVLVQECSTNKNNYITVNQMSNMNCEKGNKLNVVTEINNEEFSIN